MNIYIAVALIWFSGFFTGCILLGQLVGWWARRHGVRYVANHLEITRW